jgi:hypothetical protein
MLIQAELEDGENRNTFYLTDRHRKLQPLLLNDIELLIRILSGGDSLKDFRKVGVVKFFSCHALGNKYLFITNLLE